MAAAFEFSLPAGVASGMSAGGAVDDWQGFRTLNPALVTEAGRLGVCFAVTRPYGLQGLQWGQMSLASRIGRWATGAGIAMLAFDRYRETDLQLNAGLELRPELRLGLGVHCLALDMGSAGIDAVPAFDLGGFWQSGIVGFGLAACRVNQPRYRNGDDLPYRLLLAIAVQPVEPVLIGLDLVRTQGEESAAFGTEFRLVPPVGLRFGGSFEPLCYSGGLGVGAGVLHLDYAYRFHPRLKETHVLGIQVAW